MLGICSCCCCTNKKFNFNFFVEVFFLVCLKYLTEILNLWLKCVCYSLVYFEINCIYAQFDSLLGYLVVVGVIKALPRGLDGNCSEVYTI